MLLRSRFIPNNFGKQLTQYGTIAVQPLIDGRHAGRLVRRKLPTLIKRLHHEIKCLLRIHFRYRKQPLVTKHPEQAGKFAAIRHRDDRYTR